MALALEELATAVLGQILSPELLEVIGGGVGERSRPTDQNVIAELPREKIEP